jgi:hypothetical protein
MIRPRLKIAIAGPGRNREEKTRISSDAANPGQVYVDRLFRTDGATYGISSRRERERNAPALSHDHLRL